MWSIIWEVGTSGDLTTSKFWFDTDGGVRIHPPSIPFLNFDGESWYRILWLMNRIRQHRLPFISTPFSP